MDIHHLPIKYPASNSSTQARPQDCPAQGQNGTPSSKHSKLSMPTAGECSACPCHMFPILDDIRMRSMLAAASLPAMATTCESGRARARATVRAAVDTNAAGASSVQKPRQNLTSRRERTTRKCPLSPAAVACSRLSSPCMTTQMLSRRLSAASPRVRPLKSPDRHLEHVRVNVSASVEIRHPVGLADRQIALRHR